MSERDRQHLARAWVALAAAAAAIVLWLAGPPGAADERDPGRVVYERNCYFCHGYGGDARTVAAALLEPAPRDFTSARALTRARMREAVRHGSRGTAMQAYGALLSAAEIEQVVDYIQATFGGSEPRDALYHSPRNGWSASAHAAPAAPFVLGQVTLEEAMAVADGRFDVARRQFLRACISCHEPGKSSQPVWRNEAVTFPEGNYVEHEHSGRHVDPVMAVFERHEISPELGTAEWRVRSGERLFVENCAHCHAEDGTGKNWIGSFLMPPPPDFSRPGRPLGLARLSEVIRDGLPETAMPAWRGILSRAQTDALIAYLRAAFPALVSARP